MHLQIHTHTHTLMIPTTPTYWFLLTAKTLYLLEQQPILLEEYTQKKYAWSLCQDQAPLTTESAMKKTEDNSMLAFIVDVRANKQQFKQDVKLWQWCGQSQYPNPAWGREEGTGLTGSWMSPATLGTSKLSPTG